MSSYSKKNNRRETSSFVINTIYNSDVFIDWKNRLKYELSKLNQDTFIEEIIKLLNGFNGWNDEKDFKNLEMKLNILKENLNDYDKDTKIVINNNNDFMDSKLKNDLVKVFVSLQKCSIITSKNFENEMNDYVRDLLSLNYEISDQTRQGKSTNRKDAGEIDLQIRKNGLPLVMIEGIKMNFLNKGYLNTHINKLITNYDPNGCPCAIVVIYATVKQFDVFYEKLFSYLENEYNYPYEKIDEIKDDEIMYSDIKHAKIFLKRNSKKIELHFFVINISK